jgi:menaquinone-dependent protoporphyrinogen oxidase
MSGGPKPQLAKGAGMRVLVAYDTKHGSSAEAAAAIGTALKARRCEVKIVSLAKGKAGALDLEGFDAAIVGGPVYAGRWSKKAAAFAASLEPRLGGMRLGLFAIGNAPAQAETTVRALPPNVSAGAERIGAFGGRIDYPKLSGFERLIVRLVSGKAESSSCLDLAAARSFADGFAS